MRKSTVTSGGRMLRAVGTQVGGGGDLKGAGRAAKPTRVALQRMVVDKEIVSFDEFERGCSAEFSTESESDWIEPAMHLFSSNSSQSKQCEKVYDAFNLLKISPSIQRMVVSLSSDKAMWDAVMKKEAVQELKKCFCEASKQFPSRKTNLELETMKQRVQTVTLTSPLELCVGYFTAQRPK
ncbi:hypothetical protein MUK42_27360 [Musa troglodytarum]|uniref:Uncharacterized protein n=1 Tax=Musa troglodytarum TaxID=320322 RepID=A0A9E7G1T2_9LILI|nr:hypothetical protein MUK42_27360 [Musa troglodytarum]